MSDKNPLFDDLDTALSAAFDEESANKPDCRDPITVEHIAHDIAGFADSQVPQYIREEILYLLAECRFVVKYNKRLGKRTQGSGAIVHFHNHMFLDGTQYIMYYSVQFEGKLVKWKLQGMFHVDERFPYHWDE